MSKDLSSANKFSNRIHMIGRVTVIVCLFCFIMLPISLSWIYKAPIDYYVTMENAVSILLTFTFSAICENISYAPVIGAAALYTSCVTGDVSNMKVPAAINAMDIVNVKPGTEKGDIISLLSVSTCTFVTTGIALLGMLFLAPIIDPIYNNPYINPAFANIIPAIFGALLVPYIVKMPKESLPILAIPIIVILIAGRDTFSQIQGYLILIVAVVSVVFSYFMNKKKIYESDEEIEQKDNIV